VWIRRAARWWKTPSPAGVAAGAAVFGYSPPEAGHDAPGPLRAAGAVHIFTSMSELAALL
jgi:beta-phosphoglucomutase-like phosphatase (HAD superfamily)